MNILDVLPYSLHFALPLFRLRAKSGRREGIPQGSFLVPLQFFVFPPLQETSNFCFSGMQTLKLRGVDLFQSPVEEAAACRRCDGFWLVGCNALSAVSYGLIPLFLNGRPAICHFKRAHSYLPKTPASNVITVFRISCGVSFHICGHSSVPSLSSFKPT